jgi:hypothetical protein
MSFSRPHTAPNVVAKDDAPLIDQRAATRGVSQWKATMRTPLCPSSSIGTSTTQRLRRAPRPGRAPSSYGLPPDVGSACRAAPRSQPAHASQIAVYCQLRKSTRQRTSVNAARPVPIWHKDLPFFSTLEAFNLLVICKKVETFDQVIRIIGIKTLVDHR